MGAGVKPLLHRSILWALLSLPAAIMVSRAASGDELLMDLLQPSGEWSIRLMVLAMLPGPLIDYFGRSRLLDGWLSIRRNLGVAAFAYAMLHLVFYIADMHTLVAVFDELTLPAIWTGWLAFVLMLVPATISSDGAMRWLGRRWKSLQRLLYPAVALALAHWFLLDWGWLPALIHTIPLIVAWCLRMASRERPKGA